MRESCPRQLRLDVCRIADVALNLDCRDELIPVLAALQHVYSRPQLRDGVLELIGQDVNRHSCSNLGREGFSYWEIMVLQAARLGCNMDYDKLQDLAENHRQLRAIMGLGEWDPTSFHWQRIRDNLCLLEPETIRAINDLLIAEAHELCPEAVRTTRADSFVMDTNIHYPTESSLIRDGVLKLIALCVPLAEEYGLNGWRQHAHLSKQIKRAARRIDHIAHKKGPRYHRRLKDAYHTLLKDSRKIVRRARELCQALGLRSASPEDIFGLHTLQAFIARTEHVQETAQRRVFQGESVPNNEKLFSIFEPHTQLYKRGKASEPIQFGRLVLVFEDAAGLITHYHLLPRDQGDQDVAVEQLRIVQEKLGGRIERASFDRGFHTPQNQTELAKLVDCLCLPKPGKHQAVQQEDEADEEFLAARQNHPGVESAIGALQAGNGLERCRDRGELGFERYFALGVLGRNLHTLGKLLIAQQAPDAPAADSRRAA